MKKAITEYHVTCVFDVGANRGDYTKLLIAHGYKGKIYCFEPHPINFKNLSLLSDQNQIEKFEIALSDTTGVLPIYDYSSSDGSEHASLVKGVIEQVHHSTAIAHQVRVDTIDNFLMEKKIGRIGLLKIDTEGNEYNVLRGANTSLASNMIDLVHFEFNEMNRVSRTFMKDFFEILSNYNIYRLLPNGLFPINANDSYLLDFFTYQNIVAIRKDLKK